MSLRLRILRILILITALTVTLSVGVGFYVAQRQFEAFVDELGRNEAQNLASRLSRAYTEAAGWETLQIALADAGYEYDSKSEHQEGPGGEGGGEASETFHVDRIRVVVTDLEGRIVRDNLSSLEIGRLGPELSGQRTEIHDLRTGLTVGHAYVDVDQKFLASESHGFLRDLIVSSIIGGLLTAMIAALLANSISNRITEPVTALTRATQAIAQQDEPTLLPVTADDEISQMSRAFNQMTGALQRQREMRKRLIDDVSHELNTPLTVIQLEAKGLQDKLQAPEQAAHHIMEEVNMLRNLVNDLDWLAETDTGDLQLHIEACAIDRLFISEVDRWQPQAQARQVSLLLHPLPRLPAIQIDPLRIRQALGNIIQNALKHSEPDQVAVRATVDGSGRLLISVADDGAGIAPADLPYIFQRHYRGDQYRGRGAGLGLDIARTIIEAHNGTIAIHSDGIGYGTTVRFRLPLTADSGAST